MYYPEMATVRVPWVDIVAVVKNATIYCIRKLIKGGTTWYMPVEYVNMTKKLKTCVFIGTIF